MPVNPSFAGETGEAPSFRTYRMRHAVVEGAAGTDFEESICTADIQGNVTDVRIIPEAALTGADATADTFSIKNRTATLTPATYQTLTAATATQGSFVAWALKRMVLGAAAQLVVNVGDILSLAKTHASTGTVSVPFTVEVDVTRSDVI